MIILPVQEVQAELGAKGGRVSEERMARLCAVVLAQQPVARHGYILDGWPKSETAAEEVFTADNPFS